MSVRDLEAEGAIPANASSIGASEFSVLSAILEMRTELRKLSQRLAVVEARQMPVEVKGTWHTGGIDQ